MTKFWFRTTLAMLFGVLVLCLMHGSADAGWRRRARCGGCDGWNGGCHGGRGRCHGGCNGGCYGGGVYYGGKYGGAAYGNGFYSGPGGAPVAPYGGRAYGGRVYGPDYGPRARSARGDGSLRSPSDRGIRAGADADIEGRARIDEGGARARARTDADLEAPPAAPSDAPAPRSEPSEPAPRSEPSEPAPRSEPPAESPAPAPEIPETETGF